MSLSALAEVITGESWGPVVYSEIYEVDRGSPVFRSTRVPEPGEFVHLLERGLEDLGIGASVQISQRRSDLGRPIASDIEVSVRCSDPLYRDGLPSGAVRFIRIQCLRVGFECLEMGLGASHYEELSASQA